jgi:hypothetical protein
MAQTLQQLRDSVDLLIEQQGLTAPCSALIFTRDDVYEIDENGDFLYLEESITNKVLEYLNDTEVVLQQAFDCISSYIEDLKV